MGAKQINQIPQQKLPAMGEDVLLKSRQEIAKTNKINCKLFSINYDMNKEPYYAQTVEFNEDLSPAKQKVYDALITFMFDKVMNIHETVYKRARKNIHGDPTKNKGLLNMYKSALGRLVAEEKKESVKEYKCIRFIDRLVSGYATDNTYKRSLKSINNQPCISVDYDLIFEHLSETFQEEYIKSPDLIEKEVTLYLETAYYAALKIINTNTTTIRKVIK